ncbi:hypothetical protein QJQ45_001806 [Haematococcus lacustris]|nr:hypothetical protein QJQ45_001806 [Haematococcus lacustris]
MPGRGVKKGSAKPQSGTPNRIIVGQAMVGREHSPFASLLTERETEEVSKDTLSSNDLPVEYGEEEYPLQPGEFCEIYNGSGSDPCAWVGRVSKGLQGGLYVVSYPFHDTGAERIEACKIRRARVLDGGMWRLIKPHQKWRDGEVASPMELLTIDDDWAELGKYVSLTGDATVQTQVKASNAKAGKRNATNGAAAPEAARKASVPLAKEAVSKRAAAGAGSKRARPAKQAKKEEATEKEEKQKEAVGGEASGEDAAEEEAAEDEPDEEAPADEEAEEKKGSRKPDKSASQSESGSEPMAEEATESEGAISEALSDDGSAKPSRKGDEPPPAKKGPAQSARAGRSARGGAAAKPSKAAQQQTHLAAAQQQAPLAVAAATSARPADIGSGLADERAFLFDPATQMGMGLDPGAIQAVSAASGRWNDNIKLELQHLAAATPPGTSLVAIQRHVAVTLATWDAVWGEYLHPNHLPRMSCALCASCAMHLEEEAASVSQQQWGARKHLVVFFGNAGIGTRGGWGAKAVTQACRKPCEAELDRSKPTRPEGLEAPARPPLGTLANGWTGTAMQPSTSSGQGRAKWRPLELCRWEQRARLPAKGKEYPALGFKKLRDRAAKAQAQQPVAQ